MYNIFNSDYRQSYKKYYRLSTFLLVVSTKEGAHSKKLFLFFLEVISYLYFV